MWNRLADRYQIMCWLLAGRAGFERAPGLPRNGFEVLIEFHLTPRLAMSPSLGQHLERVE